MYMLKDGWREESSEGPYTETLQTKVIEGESYQIYRLYDHKEFVLRKNSIVLGNFSTLQLAKDAAVADSLKGTKC